MKKKKRKEIDKLLAEISGGMLGGAGCLLAIVRSIEQRPEYCDRCALIDEVDFLQRALVLISNAYESLDELETKLHE